MATVASMFGTRASEMWQGHWIRGSLPKTRILKWQPTSWGFKIGE
jgi:hypothetical protein